MTFEPDTISQPQTAPETEARPETFCSYLARQFMARHGFSAECVAEAGPIAAQSDIVVSFYDGMWLTIIGMIDREAHPDKAFSLTFDALKEIAEACLKYSGEVTCNKMPVTIQLMEIGPPSQDHVGRLSLLSKTILSAWVINPATGTLWTTAAFNARGTRKFIQTLLTSPREEIVVRPPVAQAPTSFPWVTAAILLVLVAVFTAEILFGIGDWEKMLQPKIATLIAFGGSSRDLVLKSGEWYRLFSAPFLHGDILHLGMNAISLAISGYVLESLVGRAWFAAIYTVGAICGSLLSLALSPANVVSVGASGAIMGLFAAMLIVSFRFPKGPTRTSLQMNAVYVLLPSLLPLTSAGKGANIDYAAHFGGAIGGILVALIALALWSRAEPRPRLQWAALLVAVVGFAGVAYAAVPARTNYALYDLGAALIPQAQMPASIADLRTKAAELSSRYPRDPRLRMTYGEVLMRNRDNAGAERELRQPGRGKHLDPTVSAPAIASGPHAVGLGAGRYRPHRRSQIHRATGVRGDNDRRLSRRVGSEAALRELSPDRIKPACLPAAPR